MADPEERHGRNIDYPVNGRPVHFPDHVVTGREALTRAGLTPASEHQLVLVRSGRTRLIGTDDDVDLREGGLFRAAEGDRSYAFTVDEVGQVWCATDMEVDEFLAIWPPQPGRHWTLERDGEPDTVLVPGGLLSFGPGGVEDIVSRKDTHSDVVLITVVTTAGTFPAEGVKRYPTSTPIATVLAQAGEKLRLTDTAGWIVTTANRDIDQHLTFAQAGLAGTVVLEWGPREGGGGA